MLDKEIEDSLPIVEEFFSFQAEGRNSGMAAYFIRLFGCNVECGFCDEKKTWKEKDKVKKEKIKDIIKKIKEVKAKNLVITGGEPTLYNLISLTNELKKNNINSFLETSGVNTILGDFTFITLSPKKKLLPKEENIKKANELKVVIENEDDFLFAESFLDKINKDCFLYLQPEWNKREKTTQMIISYIKKHPYWRLSLQMNKYINEK